MTNGKLSGSYRSKYSCCCVQEIDHLIVKPREKTKDSNDSACFAYKYSYTHLSGNFRGLEKLGFLAGYENAPKLKRQDFKLLLFWENWQNIQDIKINE